MSDRTIPINDVPKDIDDLESGRIYSPLKEDFKWTVDGQEIVIPGKKKIKKGKGYAYETQPSGLLPMPAIMIVANHIAKTKVIKDHKRKAEKETDEKKKEFMEREAIPQFREKVWKQMKKMIKKEKSALVSPKTI